MQPPRSRTDALSAIPVVMPDVRVSVTTQDLIRITHPAILPPWLRRLLPSSLSAPRRTLELDSMGSFVWRRIDGVTSVAALAGQVAERYSCLLPEAEQSVALFLRTLGQRGVIALRHSS